MQLLKGANPCMGHFRGGLTTKIHTLVDGHGLPIRLHPFEEQASHCRYDEQPIDAVAGTTTYLAQKVYDSYAICRWNTEQGSFANIPDNLNKPKNFDFSSFIYNYGILAERFAKRTKITVCVIPNSTNEFATYLRRLSFSWHDYVSLQLSQRQKLQFPKSYFFVRAC